jgi:hypothetical protein
VKVADTFTDHPKVLAAGEDAAWLFVSGLCYCSRHLTDGFIPSSALRKITGKPRPQVLAARLVSAGLWEPVEGGWNVHHYLEQQRSKEEVEYEREANRERQTRWRSRQRNGVTNGDVTALVTEPPKRTADTDNPQTPAICASCSGRGEVLLYGEDTMSPCPDCRPGLRVVGDD